MRFIVNLNNAHKNSNKNTYKNRRAYSDREIQELYDSWHKNGDPYWSPLNGQIFSTEKLWRSNLSRYLDKESCHKFLILCNHRLCLGCRSLLRWENTKSNLNKYCVECTTKEIWKTKEYIGHEALAQRTAKVSLTLTNLYKSEKGQTLKKSIGSKNSVTMKAYLKTDDGQARIAASREHNSRVMRQKIRNGEFIPAITNSRTHWKAIIEHNGEEKRFRSSWEACFWLSNTHLLYEHIRIPYVSKGKDRTYISDFFDPITQTIYEIKPIAHWNDAMEKMTQAINWCLDNNIKFIWINEKNIWEWIDETKFDGNNLKQLEKLKGPNYAKVANQKDYSSCNQSKGI